MPPKTWSYTLHCSWGTKSNSFGNCAVNDIILLTFGFGPDSFGCVLISSKGAILFVTSIEFRSKDINGFFISINVNGFKSLNPKALMVKLYSIVSGSISIFFTSSK